MKTFNIYRLELIKEKSVEYQSIASSEDAADIFKKLIGNAAEEYLWCVGLDTRAHIVGAWNVSHGTIDSSIVHPREIFKRLMLSNCSSFIIAHNHPSGSVEFSAEDIEVTRRLKEASEILGIKMLDHLIISDFGYCSARAQGLI